MNNRRASFTALVVRRREVLDKAAEVAQDDPHHPSLAASTAALAHLDALIDGHTRLDHRHQRWGLLALFALFCLLVLGATLWHRSSATIDLKAIVSSVRMKSRVDQPLTELIGVSDVVLIGMDTLEGPEELGFGTPTSQLRLQGSEEHISMEPIEIPADGWATMETAGPGRYRLSLKFDTAITVSFGVVGRVRSVMDGEGRDKTETLARPREIVARWKRGESVAITFATPAVVLTRAVDLDALEFTRQEFVGQDQLIVSTVRTGQIVFPDYETMSVPLSEGTMLTLGGLRGYAPRLTVHEDALDVAFRGLAEAVALGEGGGRRNRLPTWLDSFTKSNRPASMFTAVVALMTWTLACFNWWRRSA